MLCRYQEVGRNCFTGREKQGNSRDARDEYCGVLQRQTPCHPYLQPSIFKGLHLGVCLFSRTAFYFPNIIYPPIKIFVANRHPVSHTTSPTPRPRISEHQDPETRGLVTEQGSHNPPILISPQTNPSRRSNGLRIATKPLRRAKVMK